MRFSVDAHAIGRHLTGNEVYVRNLLEGFAALDQEAEFIAYLSSDLGQSASMHVPASMTRRYVSPNSLVRLGFDLSRQLRRDRPELIHVNYTAPLACPVPVVVTVHDISFLEHPEYFPWQQVMQLRVTVRHTVQHAARVLTVSEFSRDAIARRWDLDPARIEVVPNGVSRMFRPVSRETAARNVADLFGIRTPYVVTVGDLRPRKNQMGLIEAFEQLMLENPSLPHSLVIVGKNTWYSARVHERARRSPFANRIIFTGWVSDQDLLWLYNAADCLAFPSLYEGFGLPILESMACGRAVACSSTSAMPEVAGSAALLFNPRSRDEIVRAMRDLLVDAGLRTRMERLGQQRASQFTWERTARRTLEIYYEAAGAALPAHLRTAPATRS